MYPEEMHTPGNKKEITAKPSLDASWESSEELMSRCIGCGVFSKSQRSQWWSLRCC